MYSIIILASILIVFSLAQWQFSDAEEIMPNIKNNPNSSILDFKIQSDMIKSTTNSIKDIIISQVSQENNPPIANAFAYPNPVKSGQTLTLYSYSYDPDPEDNITSYLWEQIDPPGGILGNSETIEITAPEVEEETTFTYSLSVTDTHGAVSTTTETVTVVDNFPPTAIIFASPDSIVESFTKVILDGSPSWDIDGDPITSYRWQSHDPSIQLNSTAGSIVEFTAPNVQEATLFIFTLNITDSFSAEGSLDFGIKVYPCGELPDVEPTSTERLSTSQLSCDPNNPPVAIIKSTPEKVVRIGQSVILDGRESFDPDGDKISDYIWKQTDDGPFRIAGLPLTKIGVLTFKAPEKVPAKFVNNNSLPKITPLKFSLDVVDEHLLQSQTPANAEIQISCTNEEEKKADEMNQIITNIITTEKAAGYEEGSKRLQHWLAGSGTPLPIEENWLSQSGDIKIGVLRLQQWYETNPQNLESGNSIKKFAQSLKSGETKPFKDTWDYAISFPNYISDYGASIGRAQIESKGDFNVSRNGNSVSVSGTVTYSLFDIFNFNPNDSFRFPIPPFSIQANDVNLLEKCRGAQPFLQDITWKQDVTFNGLIAQMDDRQAWKWTPEKWNTF